MARDNETNTLELHIKVNGQNLSAISEKCNVGTLRIPPDPSWPKIPPRRSSNNTDDIIEPPCVVTLTGTPKKGRSIVQPVACQHLKSKSSQKYEAITHIGKRLPGCFDPRFRRQITRQKAEKPDEFCKTKHDRQTPELDIQILQETEQHDEDKSRETGESVDGLYTPAPCHDVDNLLSSVGKSTKKTADKQSILEAKHCPWNNSLQHATNERHDVGSGFISQGEKQESNRPLLLMVDEKKIHALPINSFNIEATCSSAPAPASASVRVPAYPVVAYRDISRMPTQMEKDVKMPSMCENDGARETVGNICTRSTISMCNLKESRNEKYPLDDVERCQSHAKNSDDIYISEKKTNKSISKYCDGHSVSTFGRRICERDKDDERYVDSNVSLNHQDVGKDKDRYGNFGALNNGDADDGRIISYSNLNTAVRLKNFCKVESCGQSCAMMPATIDSSSIADGECDERKMSSERKMVNCKTWMTMTSAGRKQTVAYRERIKAANNDRDNAGCNPSANAMTNDKILEKGMESLVSSQVCGIKGYSDKSNKDEKECKREEDGRGRVRVRRVNVKRKAAPLNLSRKAKSFFRKKSRLAITDSDCTLILPGYRCAARVKGKRYEKTHAYAHAHAHGRSKVSLPLHRRNGLNSMNWNSILVKYNASKQGRINSRLSTNLRVGNLFEKPSSIPLETRELLNKSYWEYYWKLGPLRRKIASAKPDNADNADNADNVDNAAALGRQRQRDRECSNEDHLPESQTLRQCSVLSCMINTALRDSTTADGRPPSDPAANVTSNARESICQVSAVSGLSSVFANKIKMKRKKMKRASKRLLGLRAIALLCIAMYVAVIFLPMMYDYFFAEEYEDENATYIELTFRYIVSSFGEALDGVIDVLTTILLRPVRFNRKQ
ncbi:uncharacterized protein [Temnothorax nylanderi]|uniref:uncharacterized protein n=1 Tax=Temnothorax nylanderi TaxID=102681 RepID=UPI003A8A70FF